MQSIKDRPHPLYPQKQFGTIPNCQNDIWLYGSLFYIYNYIVVVMLESYWFVRGIQWWLLHRSNSHSTLSGCHAAHGSGMLTFLPYFFLPSIHHYLLSAIHTLKKWIYNTKSKFVLCQVAFVCCSAVYNFVFIHASKVHLVVSCGLHFSTCIGLDRFDVCIVKN